MTAGANAAARPAAKTVLIGIDGLRIDDALDKAWTPALAALVSSGSFAHMEMEAPTISGPGWSSVLTGTPHSRHGVCDNSFSGHRLATCPDLLSRASMLWPGLTTFAAVGWPPLAEPLGPGPILRFRPEDQRAGLHRVAIRDGEVYGYRWADEEIAAIARLVLREGEPDLSFVYLGETDEAAHLHGVGKAYREAAGRVDAHLTSLLEVIADRAALGGASWQVAVTTDHGHLDEGGHGGGEAVLTRSFLALAETTGRPGDIRDAFRPVDRPLPAQVAPSEIAGILLGAG